MKAILINASPRKNRNTAAILERVREGLEAGGCETKTVHLADLSFTGCKGCLACKVKGSRCNGLCALRDDLRPVLEEVLAADILVLGSPVYWHYPTALARAFTERLLFAPLDYENPGASVLTKKIRCATVYTMHVFNDELFNGQGYDKTLAVAAQSLSFLGSAEVEYFRGLSTFPKKGVYAASEWFENTLDKVRTENYPAYEESARDLGRRLAGATN